MGEAAFRVRQYTDRVLIRVHAGLLLAATAMLACVLWQGPELPEHVTAIGLLAARIALALSVAAGLVLMATRSGKSESILLAISTLSAFLLVILTCGVDCVFQ